MSYKIYVHHNYSYELFWYFFHGIDINYLDVPTHTSYETAFNKFKSIDNQIELSTKYKGNKFDIIFSKENNWDKEGYHYFDFSIDLLERKIVADRGFNSNVINNIDNVVIPHLNSKASSKSKVVFFYIDWEGHNPYFAHNMDKVLNKNITLVVDELKDEVYEKNINFKTYSFTHNIMSFIYPNTIWLRDYIFFADYLKYKNDYKYKMNFPIRRLYGPKVELFHKINSLKNKSINITHSSFHNTIQYAGADETVRSFIIDSIDDNSYINKRGYGIHDFGGEWNDSNMNEFLWKMFGIAEVSILPEYSPELNHLNPNPNKKQKMLSNSYLTEKSISHVFAGKPFIPMFYTTIEFYENMIRKYGYTPTKYPIKYKNLFDIIDNINDIGNSDKWEEFRDSLQLWVNTIRNAILSIVDNNNDVLDYIIKQSELEKDKNIL